MSTKVKVSGAWTDAKPHVKVGGTWTRVKKAYSKAGGSWDLTYEYESVYTLNTGEQVGTIDFDALALDRHHNVRVVVPSGATLVAPSTSTYAIKTGTSHNAKITLENNGAIYGRGGNGGGGGYRVSGSNSPSPTAGANGGSAIHIESNITLINNGTILGGGGGGGGGEGTYTYRHAGGGGGGGGAPYGTGGAGRTTNGSSPRQGAAGATAGLIYDGAGGLGAYTSSHDGMEGGRGGNGGNVGVHGSSGGYTPTPNNASQVTGVGARGLAGAAFYNPNNFTIS